MKDESDILTAERLAEFRGDVESLKRRNQRFAQMLVADFELLIATAEQAAAHICASHTTEERAVLNTCPVCLYHVHKNNCAAYNELLFAVARKFPEETRHQTALRYLREVEQNAALGRDAATLRK